MFRKNAGSTGCLTAFLLRATVAVLAFVVWVPGIAAQLSLTESTVEGKREYTVRTSFYRASIRPSAGATITSLRFGRTTPIESTLWNPGIRSGLLQEVNTADMAYEKVKESRSESRVVLSFGVSAGALGILKRFEFRRNSPVIRVSLRFENRSDCRIAGYETPGLKNLIALNADDKPITRYYCFDDNSVPRAMIPSKALRTMNAGVQVDRKWSWLAVTDPATRRAVGFILKDSAPRSPLVSRNRGGDWLVGWDYPALPAGSVLESQLLVVPLTGFAALSDMNEQFAADTVAAGGQRETPKAIVQIMPLQQGLKEVSVVTRAYGQDGKELQPCEPLVYEEVPAYQAVRGAIDLPAGENEAAWLMHEVYSQGTKIGQFLGRLDGRKAPPELSGKSLEPPAWTEADYPDISPNAAEQERGFTVLAPATGPEQRLAETVAMRLFSNEWETLFFGVRAVNDIETLRVGLTSGGNGPDDSAPLPPAAGYTWSVRDAEQGARLLPYADGGIRKGDTRWLAVTIDTSQLEPTSYSSRIYIEADGKSAEVPIEVQVSALRLMPHEGFALWDVNPGKDERPGRLVEKGISIVGQEVGGRAGWNAGRLLWQAGEAGVDLLELHAPGRAPGIAESHVGNNEPELGAFPAGAPVWLLWESADSPAAPARLRRMGMSVGILADRLAGLKGSPLWRDSQARFRAIQSGCGLDVVSELLDVGWVRPDDSIWVAVDTRNDRWIDAGVRLRRMFWAAAWQGLSGVAARGAVRQSEGPAPGQMALWHVLRDAREEAAACAWALEKASRLASEDPGPDDEDAAVERARILARMDRLVGRGADTKIEIQEQKTAFRTLPRGHVRDGLGVAGFREVRNHAMALLEGMYRLSPAPTKAPNLYWRGIPLLKDGVIGWATWQPGGDPLGAKNRAFRKRIRERTGRDVASVAGFPPAESVKLVWVFGQTPDAQGLPEPLINGMRNMSPRAIRRVTLENDVIAVIVGAEVSVRRLLGTLTTMPTLYRPARGVR